MNDITIKKYGYKQVCDMRGCKNLAEISIGAAKYPDGQKLNICDECLNSILKAAKDENLINIEPMEPLKLEIPSMGIEDKLNLTIKDLKAICKSRGLTGYSTLDREGLLKFLEGNK